MTCHDPACMARPLSDNLTHTLMVNLRVIAELKHGDKLGVLQCGTSPYLQVDLGDEWGHGLLRRARGETRVHGVKACETVVQQALETLSDDRCDAQHMRRLLHSSKAGLSCLMQTYKHDRTCSARIATLMDAIGHRGYDSELEQPSHVLCASAASVDTGDTLGRSATDDNDDNLDDDENDDSR
jgi:hypothetical protein